MGGEKAMKNDQRIRQRIAETKLNQPPGTRPELIHMEDSFAPVPPGTWGTVQIKPIRSLSALEYGNDDVIEFTYDKQGRN